MKIIIISVFIAVLFFAPVSFINAGSENKIEYKEVYRLTKIKKGAYQYKKFFKAIPVKEIKLKEKATPLLKRSRINASA